MVWFFQVLLLNYTWKIIVKYPLLGLLFLYKINLFNIFNHIIFLGNFLWILEYIFINYPSL